MSAILHIRFDDQQLATLDAYLETVYEQFGLRVTRSQAIRDMIGKQIRAAGLDWPDDPQRGGDRRSPRAKKPR